MSEFFDVELEQANCISDKDVDCDFICQICMNYVSNPVSCSHCDTLYCEACINRKKMT